MAIARHKTRQRELREGRALSRRAQRGDRRAFELLYASYESRLYRFCHRLTGSEIAAAALVEATFARALANLPTRGVPIDVAAHLYATARVLAYQSHTNGGPPRADADGGEHVREVRSANRRLAPRQRMVLALRDLEGRSDEEIARTLGTEVPAVAALVARARLRLRAELSLPAAFGGCVAVLPGLSAYADGTLPFDERPPLESHVAGCAHCRAALFAFEEAALRYRALPVPLPPGELSTRMASALDAVGLRRPAAAAAESSGATGGRQTAAAAAMAALVVVGAGVTILASRDGRETGEPERAPAPPPPQQQRAAAPGEAITRSSLAATTTAPRTTPARRLPPATHHLRAGPRRVKPAAPRTQSVAHTAASSTTGAKPRAVSPAAPASPPAPAPLPAPVVKEPPRKIPVEILPPVAPPHTPATADAPPPPPEPPPPAETTPA